MKHLTIANYGSTLGISADRLAVRQKHGKEWGESLYPLNRLRTVSIAKGGVSVSSDLMIEFAARGIHLFILDFRGVAAAALVGSSQHAVVSVRQSQMLACREHGIMFAQKILQAKIKNQRAVLKYFHKYHQHTALNDASVQMEVLSKRMMDQIALNELLGLEGAAAAAYFQALVTAQLLPESFLQREGRGSQEVGNAMLNLGYAVLSSRVMSAILRAGLEPYLGFLHTQRPGKPSLVLDLMEEYRAWTVDRIVIKLRNQSTQMDSTLKKAVISGVQEAFTKRYIYQGKKLKLEHILQRQIYRLAGNFSGQGTYRPFIFKW